SSGRCLVSMHCGQAIVLDLLLLPPRTVYTLRPLFFLNPPPTPEIYTLSLHDALPIWGEYTYATDEQALEAFMKLARLEGIIPARSEEHTSELQSGFDLVCRLLLEKKKNTKQRSDKIKGR